MITTSGLIEIRKTLMGMRSESFSGGYVCIVRPESAIEIRVWQKKFWRGNKNRTSTR